MLLPENGSIAFLAGIYCNNQKGGVTVQSVRVQRQPLELPENLYEILPRHLTDAVRRCGAWRAEELRLHRGRIATVTCAGRNYATGLSLREDEMNDILYRMCGGSLYAYNQTISQGFLTMEGGIRVGVCGSAAMENGKIIGVNNISGLIIRIPHRPEACAEPVLRLLREMQGLRGILIYAPPGVGKTTLLRAAAAEAASGACALRTEVVDTREELFPALEGEEMTLDVLVGYPRDIGIEIAVRSLGAELVICDEIGGLPDAHAILRAANCGVPIIATAHAAGVDELLRRPSMQMLHRAAVFGAYVRIERDGRGSFRYRVCRWEELPNGNA